uniref:Uncharacterized protein n=1 Tax=viral metagenome TaxID=1070528 RepID=A0A6C0EH94_9ZZZZ
MTIFSSSAKSIYVSDTNFNSSVSASATASATSNVSLDDANNIAQQLANNLAEQKAINDANIINQSVNIVNNEFIQPLQNFHNSMTSNNNIRMDQVIDSLIAFKSAIYNVNYLTNLIKQHSREIIEAGDYSTVLKPIVEKEYYNKSDDFWITSILPNWHSYYFNKYPEWNNLSFDEVYQYNKNNHMDDLNDALKKNINYTTKAIVDLINKYSKNKKHYYFSVIPWNNSLSLKINYIQPDILNNSTTISIGARIDLSPFIPNTNDLSVFSQEYLTFINDIANEIESLNNNDFNEIDIFPYISPVDFNNARCLNSKKYPYLTNQLISKCYIKDSDVDYPNIIYNQIKDLYYNYPPLVVDDIALLSFKLGDTYYISLVKIDIYNETLCFKSKYIAINPYFTHPLNIVNDTSIQGSFNVQTYDGNDIIKTDNISKITTFHNKIGVNQESYNVKGLLDIDNLSNNSFLNILNDFVQPQLYSYDVTMSIKKQINYGDRTVNIPLIYKEKNIFVFKSQIQNLIQQQDIQFLYVSSNNQNAFNSATFSQETFPRIQQIVNELNKMQPEYDLNTNTQACLFTFIELLNDTNYWYLCCLRGFIKINPTDRSKREIYFVCSFLNINEFIINKSYTRYMNELINKMSSCCRLLNYSNLLVNDPDIESNLLKGQNISSSSHPNSSYFSDKINNSSHFRERFGGKDLYVYCVEYFNNKQIQSNTDGNFLFNEKFSYYNNKQLKSIFKQETDDSIYNIHSERNKRFNSSYGDDKTNLSFIIKYIWTNGIKISVENVIIINNTKYMLGCGFNLSDVLDDAIIVKGDNTVTGNLTVLDDATNVPIFQINREKKQIYGLYQTGIGTDNPNAALDINDVGMNDILNVIHAIAKEYNVLNNNVYKINSKNIETALSDFIDPVTKLPIVQLNSRYYYINKLDIANPSHSTVIYSWLYPIWNGKVLNEIEDVQNKTALNLSIANIEKRVNENLCFDHSDSVTITEWIFGKKMQISRNFLSDDGNLYSITTGVDLQTFNLTYHQNTNVSSLMQLISALNSYIQLITSNYNNVDIASIVPNYQIVNENYIQPTLYTYPFSKCTFKKIVPNSNPYLTIITSMYYDFNTGIVTTGNDTVKLIDLVDKSDQTSRFKYINWCVQLAKNYTNLKQGDYGVLNFEDENVDYIGLFVCIDTNTFLSLDYQINNILQPASNIRGDVRILGDLLIKDINNPNSVGNFLNVDPTLQFIGVGSDERYINYPYSFPVNTTSNIYSSKQFFHVQGISNPLSCFDRITENSSDIVNPSNDINELVKETSNTYKNFRSFSAATIRRTSKLYSVEEMYNYALANSRQNNNFAKYGVEISAEITDKNDFTQFIGNMGFVIDNLDDDNKIQAGFIIRAYDVDTKVGSYKQPRPIMYLENNSTLHVDNIVVGKTTPLSVATGPSNIKVDSITLDSVYNMYVKKTTDNNGNAIENLYWGNVLLGSQPVTETLINQALQNQC